MYIQGCPSRGGRLRNLIFSWTAKYGGMESSDITTIKDLENERRHLKQMFADPSLECLVRKDVIEKSFKTSDKA